MSAPPSKKVKIAHAKDKAPPPTKLPPLDPEIQSFLESIANEPYGPALTKIEEHIRRRIDASDSFIDRTKSVVDKIAEDNREAEEKHTADAFARAEGRLLHVLRSNVGPHQNVSTTPTPSNIPSLSSASNVTSPSPAPIGFEDVKVILKSELGFVQREMKKIRDRKEQNYKTKPFKDAENKNRGIFYEKLLFLFKELKLAQERREDAFLEDEKNVSNKKDLSTAEVSEMDKDDI